MFLITKTILCMSNIKQKVECTLSLNQNYLNNCIFEFNCSLPQNKYIYSESLVLKQNTSFILNVVTSPKKMKVKPRVRNKLFRATKLIELSDYGDPLPF